MNRKRNMDHKQYFSIFVTNQIQLSFWPCLSSNQLRDWSKIKIFGLQETFTWKRPWFLLQHLAKNQKSKFVPKALCSGIILRCFEWKTLDQKKFNVRNCQLDLLDKIRVSHFFIFSFIQKVQKQTSDINMNMIII